VVDGDFKVGSGNSLSYHIKRSDNIDTPQEIKFSGGWSIGKNHDLAFTLDKWNNQCEGNKLILKSVLAGANKDELAFTLGTRDVSGGRRVYILKLNGAWQADKYNRLAFNVERDSGAKDELVLRGKWEIGRQNEIIYTASRARLKTKDRIENTITLQGHWDISAKNRLSYALNNDGGPRLDFKATFERAENRALRYGLSIGYGVRRKTISLFGKWKVNKDTELFYEIANAGGDNIKVKAELSRTFLKGRGEAFIKGLVSRKEAAVIGGIGFRW